MEACAKGLPLVKGGLHLVLRLLGDLRTLTCFAFVAFPVAGMLGHEPVAARGVHCVIAGEKSSVGEAGTVTAVPLAGPLDQEGLPARAAWENAPPIRFDQDWQGKNGEHRGRHERGEGDQKGQTGPAPAAGGEASGGAAKAQP